MRAAIALTAITMAIGLAAPAQAADVSYQTVTRSSDGTVAYHFGKREPWSYRGERPPRKGKFFWTYPIPRTVNSLVPEGFHHRRPKPWTAAWYEYCASRWPSFNPNTGMVRTPDGPRKCF